MQRRLIVVGDSHTVTFTPFDRDVAAIFTPGPITADAFCRVNHALTQQTLKFLSSVNPDAGVLVLCMSEIDIRTHYWRDIPVLMSRGMPLEEVVAAKVRAFVQQATAVCDHFGYREFILWGAPASNLPGATYNAEYPTTGDNVTRNILTHLFCRNCVAIAEAGHPKFRFATLFYHMVSDDFATDATWLTDTIHVTNGMKPLVLSMLAPIVDGNVTAIVGERIKVLNQRPYAMATIPSARPAQADDLLPHRAWVSTAQAPQIRFDDSLPYGFSLAQDLKGRRDTDQPLELALRSTNAAHA